MPIHDVGYRAWKGNLTAAWSRWWTISEVGIRTALSSRWIRRIILASWFPVIYFGVGVFIFEKTMDQSVMELVGGSTIAEQMQDDRNAAIANATNDTEVQRAIQEIEDQYGHKARKTVVKNSWIAQRLPDGDALVQAIDSGDESTMRRTVWAYLLSTFLRYPQGMVTLMIVGLVVPPLISRDVRSRAFLLYYSRPITRFEYLLGKIVIPGFILGLVTFLPAMVLYFVALMLSPDLSVVMDTWDLPFRVVLAAAVCIIPTCLIGLLFSSMTQESRFAGFAWFAVWGLGAVVWFGIYMTNSNGGNVPFDSNWSLISIYSTIGRVQSWIFGLDTNLSHVGPSIVTLLSISAVSFLMLYRRVSAPIRV